MKKIFVLIICLFSFISMLKGQQSSKDNAIGISETGDKIIVSFHLPPFALRDTSLSELYHATEKFTYIQINNAEFGIIDSVGLPMLPQLTFDLHLPKNAIKFDLRMLSTNIDKKDVAVKIVPYQEDIMLENPVYSFYKNEKYYNSDGGFCDFYAQISDPFIIFGEQGVRLTIFPFSYNPKDNKLTVLKDATIEVSYALEGLIKEEYHTEAKDNYLSVFFKNYKSDGKPIKGRFLMIADPTFESILTYFANYKRNIGFDVVVVNTNVTGRSASEIKKYIQGQYNNSSTRPDYVLLVGDSQHIPAYSGNASGNDIDDPITDLNYALLEGKDEIADVFLGRFSVNGSDDLINIINKTIFMEMNMHRFKKEAKFIAGDDESSTAAARNVMRNSFKKAHNYVIDYSFNPC